MGPGRNNGHRGLVSDINVTPLVDVMLVLLIIFMVTAPMMTQGLNVNLPETTAKSLRQESEPTIVSIDKNGEISLGKIKVNRALLFEQLHKLSDAKKKNPIFLQADKDVPYGVVVSVMADIKRAGFEKLGMVTKPSEKTF
jgi:biopolymer transport protein TolR